MRCSIFLHFGRLRCQTWPRGAYARAALSGDKTLQIYVATTREREISSGNVFTANSANALNFAKFVVSVPPTTSPAMSKCPTATPIHGVALL